MRPIGPLLRMLLLLWIGLAPVADDRAGAQPVQGTPIAPLPFSPESASNPPAKPPASLPGPYTHQTTAPVSFTPTNHSTARAAEYPVADFEALSAFVFRVPDVAVTNQAAVDEVEKQIPAAIKGLDGKKAAVRGFMLPIKDAGGKATEFLVMKNQMSCCFGGAMGATDFVTVKVPGKGVEMIMDEPVTIQGVLHVGSIRDSGFIVGLYSMEGVRLLKDQ